MRPAIDEISREQMVAVAAYYLAEQRGFVPGNEMSDWLDAEANMDRMPGNRSPAPST